MTPFVPAGIVNFCPLGIRTTSQPRLKLNSLFSCIVFQIKRGARNRKLSVGRDSVEPTNSRRGFDGSAGASPYRRWRSELGRIFEKFDHAFEQTRCAASIDAAMIETQRDLRLGFRDELFLRFVPGRDFFADAE